MKYTQHKLSERQCKVLSQIVNNRLRNVFGPTLDVLVRYGLVGTYYPDGAEYYATTSGVDALREARKQGW